MSETPTPWHTLSLDETFAKLTTSPDGLPEPDAAARLTQYGPNELQKKSGPTALEIFFEQFKDVLILLLLGATVISAVLGEVPEAIAIGVIVIMSATLGFVQEYRAERAIEALREMAAPTALVRRGGAERTVPARELVPGDLIILNTGDRVPADCRISRSINLKIEEAALTGESLATEKIADPIANPAAAVGDRKNMAYAGTSVVYGRGEAVVAATGMSTEFGKIAGLLDTVEQTDTPLQQNLDRVGKALLYAALVIVALIFAIGAFRILTGGEIAGGHGGEGTNPWLELFISAVALAVAAVPEALPAVVTISLAIGVQQMVKRNALVRRLPAVETLGSTAYICSDKTGTLTKDEMTVRQVYNIGKVYDLSGTGYAPEGQYTLNGAAVTPDDSLITLLRGGLLCNDSSLIQEDGLWDIKGDPTEGALVVAAAKAGLQKTALNAEFPRIDEIPFSSETKRMTTVHQVNGARAAYSKGAPEILIERCTHQLTAAGITPLDEAGRQSIRDQAAKMAEQAMRVLAVARKDLAPDALTASAEQDLTFLGLYGMIDPPRPEARDAIAICNDAGIKPVMITGDHQITARAIANELGMIKTGRSLTGAELEDMPETEFEKVVEDIEVYARVSPSHKLRVVTALQKKGYVVAMTGDGVNDAPALKRADIGIAMGITGTDVTKEAADMMLLDDNFASIVAAVEEGRGIFGNIKNYLMFLLSSNIGEILVMAIAAFIGLPLPLTAVQLLFINLATDGLPALALSIDPPDPDLMKRKPRSARTGIFTRPVIALMLIGGIWSAIVNLGLFVYALNIWQVTVREAQTIVFVSLILIQFFKAYAFRSDRVSTFVRPFSNKWLNLSILASILFVLPTIYVPALHSVFDTYSLPLQDWLLLLPLAVTIIPVLELGKFLVRRGVFGSLND